MAAREFLRLVQETSFGVPVSSPTNGTSAFWMRLSGSNYFKCLMKPIVSDIQWGGGYSVPGCAVSDQSQMQGPIQGELYPGISKFLLDWAATPINTGRTTPWTTTDANSVMPVGDLASVSAYHGVQEASTFKRRRASGVKVSSLTIQASRQSPIFTFNANVVGVRDDTNAAGTVADPDATEFPAPTDSVFACGPYLFSHAAGGLKIGTSRTLFDSITLTITNKLQPLAWEARYPQTIGFYGREVTLQVGLYRKPSMTDLDAFRALTANDVELALDNGTNTLTLDMQTNARWTELDEDLPIDSAYRWVGTLKSYYDTSVGNDFTVTYAADE